MVGNSGGTTNIIRNKDLASTHGLKVKSMKDFGMKDSKTVLVGTQMNKVVSELDVGKMVND